MPNNDKLTQYGQFVAMMAAVLGAGELSRPANERCNINPGDLVDKAEDIIFAVTQRRVYQPDIPVKD